MNLFLRFIWFTRDSLTKFLHCHMWFLYRFFKHFFYLIHLFSRLILLNQFIHFHEGFCRWFFHYPIWLFTLYMCTYTIYSTFDLIYLFSYVILLPHKIWHKFNCFYISCLFSMRFYLTPHSFTFTWFNIWKEVAVLTLMPFFCNWMEAVFFLPEDVLLVV